MKKVAGVLLIGISLSSFAQTPTATPAFYRLRSTETAVTEKRFRKILGDNYDGQDAARRLYDEERKRRRNRNSNDEDYDGPDYARPNRLIEMGLRIAPSLMLNTADGLGTYSGFMPNGSAMRISIGPTLDYFFFKDRYALSTGLWYTVKRSGFMMPGSFGESRWKPGTPDKESVYNLQYVQVPVTAKMFANHIAPNLRLYVQTGGLLSLKLAEKPLDKNLNALYMAETGGNRRQYGFGDIELLLGTGVQYKLNRENAVNLGISYQRGLLDQARGNELTSKSRVVALEFGFQF